MSEKSLCRSHLPWLIVILAMGLITRVPHLVSIFSSSSETAITYFPTLAAARFEQCARSLADGTVSGDAFVYASPMYILLLAPLYAMGIGNTAVFILQSCLGIFSALFVYFLSVKTGVSKVLSCTAAILWLFYAPAAFYETTLLPKALLSILITLWAILETTHQEKKRTSFLQGFVSGLIAGLRPPFIFLGIISLIMCLRHKMFSRFFHVLSGFVLPLIILSVYHVNQGGDFSPFVAATGLTLVLGHADGASGYGPPIPEYGLIETPGEDIHQVAARIAAANGFTDPSDANSFWFKKAIGWIVSHPSAELRLAGIKLGAFFGYKPFCSYYDLSRDISSDSSLKHLIVPRYLLVAFIVSGIVPFLMFSKSNRILALPFFIALLSCVFFLHSERFWLPAVPAALAISSCGLLLLVKKIKTRSFRTSIVSIVVACILMLPGIFWPVPEIPAGTYFYNRAAKAYNLRHYILALTLFEEAAEASPPHSTTSVYARMEALRIAQALNLEDRIAIHTQALQRETE